MPLTTTSRNNGEFGSNVPMTVTYPEGSAGDTLFIWLSGNILGAPFITGDLLSTEEIYRRSDGNNMLLVYKRARQENDISVTFDRTGGGVSSPRLLAIVANIPLKKSDVDSLHFGLWLDAETPAPVSSPYDYPALLLIWWSFSAIALTPPAEILEDQQIGDPTTGLEMRLYKIREDTLVSKTDPSHPTLTMALRYRGIVRLRPFEDPWLRQRQRDDVERVGYAIPGNHPTSLQRSLRQKGPNTYL